MYKKLTWDSELFGYNVAKLSTPDLDEIQQKNFTLAYLSLNPEDDQLNEMAQKLGGFLADEKVTYIMSVDAHQNFPTDPHIHSYLHHAVTPQLTSLALQSGVYSRFKLDPHFTHHEFEKLYGKWLENSLGGEIAKDVLVYAEDGTEFGLLTLGEKNGRADIGLLSVDEHSRGKSIGQHLLHAAFDKAHQWGYKELQVVTQKQNAVACRFYEKFGFRVERVENIYHFWLDK